jgi:hypothetical protein
MLVFTSSSTDSKASAYNMSQLEFEALYENNHTNGVRYLAVPTDKTDPLSQNFNVSLPAGRYSARVFVEGYGFSSATIVAISLANVTMNAQTVSYTGGTPVALAGLGF